MRNPFSGNKITPTSLFIAMFSQQTQIFAHLKICLCRLALRIFVLFCGFQAFPVHYLVAESFDEWVKKSQKGRLEQKQEFAKYQSERDKEFSGFLKKKWKEFLVQQGINRDQKPKPSFLPAAPAKTTRQLPEDNSRPSEKEKSLPIPKKESIPETPPKSEIVPQNIPKKKISGNLVVAYYGTSIGFVTPSAFSRISLPSKINNKSISNFWENISSIPTDDFLEQTRRVREERRLNDWGYGQLIFAAAKKLYPQDKNRQRLFTWYAMNKAGFQVRVGYYQNQVILMPATQQTLYGVSSINFQGEKFFLIDFEKSKERHNRVFSYPGNYQKNNRPLDLRLQSMPLLDVYEKKTKDLQFQFRKHEFTASIPLNKNVNIFLDSYPQTTFAVYFSAPLEGKAYNSLVPFVKKNIKGMNQVEAMNFVLRLVQQGFTYAVDQEQFGSENYLFPDETLFYSASDCEDRVAIFSFLMREVFDKKILALHYPKHVGAAVQIDDQVKGDQIKYEGKSYVIADPTYRGADLGMSMPQFKNVTPKIIKF